MIGKAVDKVNNMFTSIGAMQTLVENFPMSLFSFGDLKFSTSFDVIAILFKILGIDREEFIEMLTSILCGNDKNGDDEDGGGFISVVEGIVKTALEANIMGILNCSVNPIISNKLLDYYGMNNDKTLIGGEGFVLNVSEIDFTGVLKKNPLNYKESKFYFDTEDYNASTLYKSKDFNAYLWYIINKSDVSQDVERIWDNRIKNKGVKKEIIRCTYIDAEDDIYGNQDKIRVQICGGRKNNNDFEPANYYKTRNITNYIQLNKTIFEFNHDFLSNLKLYDKKVILAEIVEYFFGSGNLSLNMGFSINEQIIEGKISSIISKILETDDLEVNDCYFSFSNDEYNEMIEKSEKHRHNLITTGDDTYEVDTDQLYANLDGISSKSNLVEDKNTIKKTFNAITATTAQDPSATLTFGMDCDWEFELIRMLVYPFVRPLFTPKVIFLLLVNKKVMGVLNEDDAIDIDEVFNELMESLFSIIKDIIIKIKDLLVDMMLSYILEKLTPLLTIFASRLLLETLKAYKDLLESILENCKIPMFNIGNKLIGNIDDVNYADIIPTQTENNQSIC